MARRSKSKTNEPDGEVPGPSPNPATNLIMADIVMRAGSYALRNVVERTFLKRRFDGDTARDIIEGRSVWQTVGAVAVAKIATRSVPGAIVVGSGLVAKTLFDRSQKRRKARREGEQALLEQAEKASE